MELRTWTTFKKVNTPPPFPWKVDSPPLKGHEEDGNPPSFLGGYQFFLDVVNKRDPPFPQGCLGQFNITRRPQRELAMFFAKNMASKYSYIANSTQNMIWNN